MRVRLLGDKGLAHKACARLILGRGHVIIDDGEVDIAIAPLLRHKLTTAERNTPRLGTLIFHPSPLPYGRGPAAIKWAYKRGEAISAATWFWAANGLDDGDICEQEIVRIDHTKSPREFYELAMIPAMVRTLKRALIAIEAGLKRQVPQQHEHASYDSFAR